MSQKEMAIRDNVSSVIRVSWPRQIAAKGIADHLRETADKD